MVHKTRGIVLRAIKYGDTSLVATLFTELYGIQAYMVQGVRSSARRQKAGFFQPGMLLDMVVYQQPQKNMQRIKEYQAAHIYTTLQESVVKNSILLFSAELLLRLLPEHAPQPALYAFASDYFVLLDKTDQEHVANLPLYFIIQCSRILGYEPKGDYSERMPHLNLQEGGYTEHAPATAPFMSDDDARSLHRLLKANDPAAVSAIELNGDARLRLTDWYVAFLQQHTQHMGSMKSLSVLRAILH